ncbi:MAG: class I SAM-dependent methyltransferase [Pyrinomonadaceae bacterium]
METDKYIPALRFDWLTAVYDPIVRLTTRETAFKTALIEQAAVKPQHRVLDLACGTGTLALLIKNAQPLAKVIGSDGDAKILTIAKGKAQTSNLEVKFDEGMSFELPYLDQSFDRVFSSLFFHHLTRENKIKTSNEVRRILKPNGELHVADWGRPDNALMTVLSNGIKLLDGVETTTDNFEGLLPSFVSECGFREITETSHFNTWFGTIRLLKAIK